MKKALIVALFVTATLQVYAQDVEQEQTEIKRIVQTAYVEGLQNEGDKQKIEEGFHPDFNLLGIGKDGKLSKYPIADWSARQVAKREAGDLPLEGDKKVSVKFKQVDVTGTAATVKLEFFIGDTLTYVDYLFLYKFESGWKIVSKIYHKI
jgi:hypothetical protein